MVVFFQGCNRGCPGCFNPQTHSQNPNKEMTAAEILAGCFKAGLEGLTVSGGEPFLQVTGLGELLKAAKTDHGLTTVVYTGYQMEELLKIQGAKDILAFIDVLIDGPFEEDRPEPTFLARGSVNQRFNLLGTRYCEADFLMKGRAEIIIGIDGTVTKTGFSRAALADSCNG
jgi:anaerobic ribonucleoside-triphosphate reductase activating protein